MADVFRTFIIPEEKVGLARAVSAAFGPGYGGLFTTPLSADAKEPILFYISSGFVDPAFASLWPVQTWEWQPSSIDPSTGQGGWVLVSSEGGNPAALYELAVAAGVECTLADITSLLSASDVTRQEPFTAMGRLDIEIVTDFAPVVANPIPDQLATEYTAFQFIFDQNTFSDLNSDISGSVLTYAATLQNGEPLPDWLSFDPTTRTFEGTPLSSNTGTLKVVVIATDAGGQSVSDTFDITVTNTNDAPVLATAIADQSATEDTAFSFQFAADAFTDADVGDSLTYTAIQADGTALSGWLAFNASTRTFSGTPLNGDVGTVSIKVTATDGSSATATDTFDITVSNVNDAPVLATAIADQSATEDTAFSFQFAADAFTDVDVGDSLTYSTTQANGTALPGWLSFNASTRTFSGTPLNGDVGTVSVKVTATDGSSATATDTFDITVATGVNLVPGTTRNDRLIGTDGRDRILGYGGDDTLTALGGNDYLDGGTGRDRMFGGTGDDYYVVDNAGDSVFEARNAGTDTVETTHLRYTLPDNVENLIYTGTGNFRGTGNALSNTITGGTGSDVLDGGSSNDALNGGIGADTLIGGRGADTLSGGAGRDMFVFNDVADLGNSLALTDVILDFEQGVDRIDLSRIDASSIDRGNNTFIWSSNNASFGTSSAGEIRYATENGRTIIYGDTDRDTQSEFQIVLRGVYTLAASDFIL